MTDTPKNHHQATATGFHLKLKEATQELHDQAESGSFQIRMVNGEIARIEFATFLGQMRHVHATLDPAIQDAATRCDRMKHIFMEDHLRLDGIDQDLNDLDSSDLGDPLPATEKFISYINEKREENPSSLIGALYVKEGATNGNKFIAMKLRETMELSADTAMRYLDPHGREQRKRWNDFKRTLNELDLTPQEEEECLDVAKETFRMVMDISKEMPKAEALSS